MRHKIYHRLDGTLNANTRNTAAITVLYERTTTELSKWLQSLKQLSHDDTLLEMPVTSVAPQNSLTERYRHL